MSIKTSIRMLAYRWLARAIAALFPRGDGELPRARAAAPRVWFHGASAGEWEGLTPVVEEWCKPTDSGDDERAVLTVFSRSGQGKVETLRSRLRAEAAGRSPREGYWHQALAAWRPRAFVTWKYDLWPDLLAALSELGIPLIVVGGSARRSLKLVDWLSALLGFRPPRTYVLPFSETDRAGLLAWAQARGWLETGPIVVDSRWERVLDLAQRRHERADALWRRFGDSPKPAAILAQVWPEDLQFWAETGALAVAQGAFQLWVVPHQVDEASIARLKDWLRREGVRFTSSRSSGSHLVGGGETECVLVDEMGALNGLYPHMSWAYVGGGFGRGIHSVVEPAAHGIPIAVGDRRTDRFPEVALLTELGQLRVLGAGRDLLAWLDQRLAHPRDPGAAAWRAGHERRRGGGAGIVAQIRTWLNKH